MALAGKLVDARRGYGAAVHPEISRADVVHQNEHHVGLRIDTLARVHGYSSMGAESRSCLVCGRLAKVTVATVGAGKLTRDLASAGGNAADLTILGDLFECQVQRPALGTNEGAESMGVRDSG